MWPLAPQGEILVVIMCEDVAGIDNLPRILKEVPGIGVVLSGEGDLSQNLGYPRQPDHPAVIEGDDSYPADLPGAHTSPADVRGSTPRTRSRRLMRATVS